ncbi:MAG TPA: hypothetical protein VI306_26345 [Pyrinomonadaceae bacterium]
MKNSFLLVIIIVVFLLGLSDAFAASRRGVQLILLPHWSSPSVDNFLDTFKDTNGRCSKGAFSEIEFGFLPYSYENPNSDNSIPTPTDKYGNAKKVIDCFRNGGKTVYVTVYLSFHAPQNNNAGGIGDNAKNFNDNFLRQYFNLARISVCPSLEDLDSDASQFPVWANLVASKIDSNLIGRVTLQRSPNGGITATMPSSNCFNEKCFATEKRTEYHGKFNSNGTVYSNDGAFVYYEVPTANGNVESSSSLISDNTYDSYSFSNFLNGTNSADNIVLLWRPRTMFSDAMSKIIRSSLQETGAKILMGRLTIVRLVLTRRRKMF